jgi:hypothetical protein
MTIIVKEFRKALSTAGEFQLDGDEAEVAVIQH